MNERTQFTEFSVKLKCSNELYITYFKSPATGGRGGDGMVIDTQIVNLGDTL